VEVEIMERQEALVIAQKMFNGLRTRRKNLDYRDIQHDLNLIADSLQDALQVGISDDDIASRCLKKLIKF
jgi:hypothetical protein